MPKNESLEKSREAIRREAILDKIKLQLEKDVKKYTTNNPLKEDAVQEGLVAVLEEFEEEAYNKRKIPNNIVGYYNKAWSRASNYIAREKIHQERFVSVEDVENNVVGFVRKTFGGKV